MKEVDIHDRKTQINIGIFVVSLIVVIIICLGCIQMLRDDSLTPEEKLVNTHFNAYIAHEWEVLYNTMTIADDQQYLKKEIFVEQMKKLYPDKKDSDGKESITDVMIDHHLNDEQNAVNYVIQYKDKGEEKLFEFSVVRDEDNKIKATPDHFIMSNFKISIPNNTDITINYERVNEKYRTKLLPTEQQYEVSLFKGIYPIILKMDYGKTKNESLYVGVQDENDNVTESYEVKYFEAVDADEKEIIKKAEEFIRAFFIGISKNSKFSYNINNYNPAILDSIENERSKYMESFSAAYSLNNVLVENIKVNSKGLVSCDVSFDLKSGTNAEGVNSVTKNWKLDLKKDGKEWIIQGVDFTKEAENEQS